MVFVSGSHAQAFCIARGGSRVGISGLISVANAAITYHCIEGTRNNTSTIHELPSSVLPRHRQGFGK